MSDSVQRRPSISLESRSEQFPPKFQKWSALFHFSAFAPHSSRSVAGRPTHQADEWRIGQQTNKACQDIRRMCRHGDADSPAFFAPRCLGGRDGMFETLRRPVALIHLSCHLPRCGPSSYNIAYYETSADGSIPFETIYGHYGYLHLFVTESTARLQVRCRF